MSTAMPVVNKISIQSSKSAEFTAIEAQFGDGYRQAAPEGLNARKDTWEIIWGGLTLSELQTIETALDGVGTWGVLTWTPCGESTQKKFNMVKPGYTRNRDKTGYKVTCQLKQCFDI